MTRPWKVMTLLAVTLLCANGFAADWRDERNIYEDDGYIYPGWLCVDCRDPAEYPADFAAFAYNAYFGELQWAFESELGIPFRVYNLDLQWVAVWFEKILFDMPSLLPNTMEIHVRLRTGEILTFTVVQGGPDLPVGDETPSGGCDCGGGGGEEDVDEIDDFEEYEAPEPDYVGTVEIVDPDENGDFPEWEIEL